MHRVKRGNSAVRCTRPRGFTLLELVVVLAVLAALAGAVISQLDFAIDDAQHTATRHTLAQVREALSRYEQDMAAVPGTTDLPARVQELLETPALTPSGVGRTSYDPQTRRGWRGPYVNTAAPVRNASTPANLGFPAANDVHPNYSATYGARGFVPSAGYYGSTGRSTVADAWGNPVVLQRTGDGDVYARLVSAGPDGVLNCHPAENYPDPAQTNPAASDYRGDDLVLFLRRADTQP